MWLSAIDYQPLDESPLHLSHLSLRQGQRRRQLALPPHGDVVVVLELLLQLQPLLVRVHHPVLVFGAGLPPWFTQDDRPL